MLLSPDIDYGSIAGISYEIQEKLTRIKPSSIVRLMYSGILPVLILFDLTGRRKTHRRNDTGFFSVIVEICEIESQG